MRLLITGMGGELGTRVAQLLEVDRDITEIVGLDVDPPRRRLRRAEFHRINPRDRTRSVAFVRAFDPDVVVHLGIYEPNARSSPRSAAERTRAGTMSVLGAAGECPSLRAIVVRSGIEVYGRRRGCATVPDESVARDPDVAVRCIPCRGGGHRRSRRARRRCPRDDAQDGAGGRPSRAEPTRAVPAHGTGRADQRVRGPDVLAAAPRRRGGRRDRRREGDHLRRRAERGRGRARSLRSKRCAWVGASRSRSSAPSCA